MAFWIIKFNKVGLMGINSATCRSKQIIDSFLFGESSLNYPVKQTERNENGVFIKITEYVLGIRL